MQCNNDCSRHTHLAPFPLDMKLHLNTSDRGYTITGHGAGFVAINQTPHHSALIVMPDQLISPWSLMDPAALTPDDFAPVLVLKPELVVFGSGSVFRFPHSSVLAAFARAKMGFEVMDTPAACRTYNVLMSEGRRVAAALLISSAS